jgi:hypothetical protein
MIKKELHKDSIFRRYGIVYEQDIPEYHIDGKPCSKAEYDANLRIATAKSLEWQNSKRLQAIKKALYEGK